MQASLFPCYQGAKKGSVMEHYEDGSERLGRIWRNFKLCDFCGALNPVRNRECFVCGWHGMFEEDSESVANALRELEYKYGAVDESLFAPETLPSELPKTSSWAGFWESIKRLLAGFSIARIRV